MFSKVLLIDDDEASTFLSETILQDMGAATEIEIATDAFAACDLVKNKNCPDIIFLDIRMPRMDGFGFLDRLAKMGACGRTKVIMLTSSYRKEDKEKALNYSNVLDYFEKPLTEQIVEKVREEYYSR